MKGVGYYVCELMCGGCYCLYRADNAYVKKVEASACAVGLRRCGGFCVSSRAVEV